MASELNSKILGLIEKYKSLIENKDLNDEVFKWQLVEKYQGKPDTSASDFNAEIQSVKYDKLLYPMSGAVIKHLASTHPEELRKLFIDLFDEGNPLTDRIQRYVTNVNELYRTVESKQSSHQDERTIATLLTFKYPEKYTLYQNTYYQTYCNLIGINPQKTGKKYTHYLELINDLIENYIKPDSELIRKMESLLPDDAFKDTNYMLLAQDIIYQTLEGESVSYWLFQCNPKIYDIVNALKELSITKWRVSQHVKDIKIGDKVILWVTGANSGCYALGEVTSEVEYNVKDVDEQKFYKDDSFNTAYNRVEIQIIRNLVDRPIYKSQISVIKALAGLKAGLQGTNFKATKAQYDALEKMTGGPVEQKYWLFAPGENAKMWDEFYEQGYMGIGWMRLGDLNNYSSKEEILARLKETAGLDDSDNPYHDATANWEFKAEMKLGDMVIVKKGRHTLLGYGYVTSDYYFDSSKNHYQKCRKVRWEKKGEWAVDHILVTKTLTDITDYPTDHPIYKHYYQRLLGCMKETPLPPPSTTHPLNTILYGPPGTGKTYSTVNKALEILGIDTNGKTRAEIKKLFDDKMKEGQIVFTTFHQSMSYEDFVEGIKPKLYNAEEDTIQQMSYCVEDGIFKRLHIFALYNIYKTSLLKNDTNQITRDDLFNKAYDDFLENVRTTTDDLQVYPVRTKTNSKMNIVNVSNNKNLSLVHDSTDTEKSYIVSKQRLLKLFLVYKNIDEIIKVTDDIRKVIGGANFTSYWAVLNELYPIADRIAKQSLKTELVDVSTDYNTMKTLVDDYNITRESWKKLKTETKSRILNYVLIIDEINRGNVAQIFGELITLIEEDKRLGNPEALEVTLPYSKEKFGVPPNLYIIGTMNTADRSIEALDTALRRRFCFEEITPRYDLVELDNEVAGFKLHQLLRKINDRIEKLIDKDHMIGHSYFMSVNDINDLKAAFQNKVNPLLQEYFFGDFGKIGLVLGAGFFEHEGMQDNESQVRFASFNDYDDEELSNHPVYRLKNVVLMNDTEFTEAIATLMR